MESYIPISFLNDFIFCPRSIYFHQLYGGIDQMIYQGKSQIEGKRSHETIDLRKYSTKKDILQALPVYSEAYKIHGKIDILNKKTGVLTERKKLIRVIYDGYIFQLYAQYYALSEMGYDIKKMCLYSMDTNKTYPIDIPKKGDKMQAKFEDLIKRIENYNLNAAFTPNPKKCARCIYSNLCDRKAEL
ncbi:MAG: type V CRISPR-associated protein Cas4 [Bacteriovoracales bacterium]|nr:type V CRISPR-associated protein Cas4 [Bacteriovoracales bacterium]